MYAAPIWLSTNLDKLQDLYVRALLKISGATHYPPTNVISQALNIPPLKVSYESITVKFMLKCLNSDNNMLGLIHQIEESKSHRFFHHIKYIHEYLKWKGVPMIKGRVRLNLIDINRQQLMYCKSEINNFTVHTWNQLLGLITPGPDQTDDSENASTSRDSVSRITFTKLLLPSHSSRMTDTKVLSLLHGHDIVFRKFKNSIEGNHINPFCDTCATHPDDHSHRLFTCPKYNCAYRDKLMLHLDDGGDMLTSLISKPNAEALQNFRIMAQISMNDI